jgi:hypothetical protein
LITLDTATAAAPGWCPGAAAGSSIDARIVSLISDLPDDSLEEANAGRSQNQDRAPCGYA